jgi:hypothetical protein
VFLSTDGGLTWSNTGLPGTPQGMAATGNGSAVFAGGDPFGVYRSTDDGATWTLVNNGLTDLRIFALLSPDGVNLLAAGAGGVFLSTDDGDNWTSVSTGLTTGVFSLAVSADGATLLAGTTGFGVWKRPLAEMTGGQVGIEDPGAFLVQDGVFLRANHPNPFAANTGIQYSLPTTMPVRLAIYDVHGRQVRKLVDSVQEAGEQRVVWDGRDEQGSPVGSGIYVVRLEASRAVLSRKMSLLR